VAAAVQLSVRAVVPEERAGDRDRERIRFGHHLGDGERAVDAERAIRPARVELGEPELGARLAGERCFDRVADPGAGLALPMVEGQKPDLVVAGRTPVPAPDIVRLARAGEGRRRTAEDADERISNCGTFCS
jgi:hypothetical protein